MSTLPSVVFFGSRPLAVRCLDVLKLAHGHSLQIVGVVAPPDPAVKWWSDADSLRDVVVSACLPLLEEAQVTEMDVDFGFSVNYPRIVKVPLLKHFRRGCFNLHGLLPAYRGRNGAAHAILNARADGVWEYGATLHAMEEAVDTGPIVGSKKFRFGEDDTALDVYAQVELAACALFEEQLPRILAGTHELQTQGPGGRYYDKDSLQNKEVDLSWDADRIWDFVRALYFPPHEKAWIRVGDRKVYLSPR